MSACPRCAKPMKDVRGVLVCLQCGGAFLAAAAVDTVTRALDDHAQSMASMAAQHASKRVDAAQAVACPVCTKAMARFRVGPVEVDTCFDHGSWYDRGELAAVRQALAVGSPTEAVDVGPATPLPSLELARPLAKSPAPSARASSDFIDGGAALAIADLQQHEREMAKHEQRRDRSWRRTSRRSALGLVDDILDILT